MGDEDVYHAGMRELQDQRDTSRNWLGIVALIFGIIGGSIIAIVFGILGLNAVKQGKANNKGMNIWGIVLGVIWSLVYIGVILALVVFVDNFKNTVEDAVKAQPGECYVSTITGTGELESANPTFGTCTGSENAIVYFVTDYTGTLSPGDADFAAELEALCISDEAAAGVDTEKATAYFVEYYVPYADSWDTDDHTIVCGLSTESGPVDPAVLLP